MSADTPDAGLTERETVDAILTLLPMSDDGTGHVADCGYTHEAPTCDCYDLPLRIAEAVAARVAAERERADAALGQIARQIEAIPTETAIERPGHGGYIRSLRGPGNVRTDALRIVRAALGDTPPGGDR